MNEVTQILKEIRSGDRANAANLLPLVYDELRRLAAQKLHHERSDHSLQATDLVHEAFLRLVQPGDAENWDTRGHFFAAAAESMRRILIDHARKKKAVKHGGEAKKVSLTAAQPIADANDEQLLALDEALTRFEKIDEEKANLVKLRYFAGLTIPQAAEALGISVTTANRHWAYARAWLHEEIGDPTMDSTA